jgi:isoquinoline 1-oxidoreductase beta subunit
VAVAQAAATLAKAPPQRQVVAAGNVDAALAGGKRVDAWYSYPYLAHAPLEPQNCTAQVTGNTVEIWAPTQNPEPGRAQLAKALGVDPAAITIHMTRCGGGFGRRLTNEYMVEAAVIARRAGVPVKLLWSREQDMQHSTYRPAGFHALSGAVAPDGSIAAWRNHFVSFGQGTESAKSAGISAANYPAGLIANIAVGASVMPTPLDTGYMRAPVSNAFGFVFESFIDELAHAGGVDPVAFRRTLFGPPRVVGKAGTREAFDTARARAVLDKVAANAGWGRALPPRSGLGVAFYASHLGYFATVAEVRVGIDGSVKVVKVWTVGDIGRQIVNPSGAINQAQGSVLDAINSTFNQAITIENGAVVQANFDTFPLLRMPDAPPVDVAFITSDRPPTGMGEPAYPPVPPALCNAIFAATGVRIRSLPVDTALLRQV